MKRSKALVAVVMAILVFITMLAGCTKAVQPSASSTQPDQPADVSTTSPATTEDQISIYILLKSFSNPYWVAMKEGIEKHAAELGVKVYVDAMNSEDDLTGQLDKMLTASDQEYDGIGIAPITPTNAIEGVVKANQKGIPVVNIDEKFDMDQLKAAGGFIAGYGTTDNNAVGQKAAEYIIKTIGTQGQVAIIEGMAGNFNGDARKNGATKALNDAGLTIVASQPADWDRNKALDVATNILTQYKDIKAFYCCNDTMALGVQDAVQNAGLAGKVIVVGTDGIDEAYKSIQSGALAGTIAQNPAQIGIDCFDMLLEAIKSGNVGSATQEPINKFAESILVTIENVNDFVK